jgi:hypothetical protein
MRKSNGPSLVFYLGLSLGLTLFVHLSSGRGTGEAAAFQAPVSPLHLTYHLTPPPPTPTPTRIPDYTPPESSFIPSGEEAGQGWYRSAVSGTFQAADDMTGVGRILYRLDQAPSFSKVPEDSRGVGKLLPITIAGEGEHRLEYYAEDSLGNTESPHTTTINIDLTAPTASHTLDGLYIHNASYGSPDTDNLDGQDN